MKVLSERPELNAGPDGNPTNYHPMEDDGISTRYILQSLSTTYFDLMLTYIYIYIYEQETSWLKGTTSHQQIRIYVC